MGSAAARREAPSTVEDAAEAMRAAGAGELRVRLRGAGTKLSWGRPVEDPQVEVSTERLDRVVEHNEGDLTAVLQAGVPLARAQEALAEADQMVALDPPLGEGERATVGGIFATADSGPLRHRYGGPRDLVLGVTVALSDGTVARAGGKVIKNVAGYDLAKLFTGSFGTLGLILEVVVRLHPRPRQTLTAAGASDDPVALGRAASSVAHSPYGPECLDVAWADGRGQVMARFGGAVPESGARQVVRLMQEAGLDAGVADDDEDLWRRQRAGQRAAAGGAVVRVSGLVSELPRVLRCAQVLGGSVVGRAGLGLSWMTLGGGGVDGLVSGVEEVRRRLHPFPCVVLDAPDGLRDKLDVWGEDDPPALMRRVKARFDPRRVCNPGIFVGGI